jgi:hypothetical protein
MEASTMKTLFKLAAATTLTGALALAAVTPSQARDGRNAAAAVGFGAGALVGAAAASANNGYYYGPGYAYDPGPGYYADDYAYAPAPTYYSGRYRHNGQSCGESPGSMNYTSCD